MIDRSLALFFFVASTLVACGSAETGAEPEGAQAKVGHNGALQFTVEPTSDLREGPNRFQIEVRDAKSDDAVSGASVHVDPYMSAMGHDTARDPDVTERGEGHYDIDNVVFTMPGIWELQIHAEKGSVVDHTAVTFDIP